MSREISRGFGIEIEAAFDMSRRNVFDALTNLGLDVVDGPADGLRWSIGSDGTIQTRRPYYQPLEIRTPILSFTNPNHMRELRIVYDFVATHGKCVGHSCGAHVHVDVRDFDGGAHKSLFRFYWRWEPILMRMVPKFRTDGTYARAWIHCAGTSEIRGAQRSNSGDRIAAAIGSHYRFLNYAAYPEWGSVEFRGLPGTTDLTKVLNWVEVCVTMVEHAKNNASGWVNYDKMLEIHDRIRNSRNYTKAQFGQFAKKLALDKPLTNHYRRYLWVA